MANHFAGVGGKRRQCKQQHAGEHRQHAGLEKAGSHCPDSGFLGELAVNAV